jgi:hypothetical protein
MTRELMLQLLSPWINLARLARLYVDAALAVGLLLLIGYEVYILFSTAGALGKALILVVLILYILPWQLAYSWYLAIKFTYCSLGLRGLVWAIFGDFRASAAGR